jgi:hypothetical protein
MRDRPVNEAAARRLRKRIVDPASTEKSGSIEKLLKHVGERDAIIENRLNSPGFSHVIAIQHASPAFPVDFFRAFTRIFLCQRKV